MPGKPPAKIDIKQLEALAQIHCTVEEAAGFMGCCKRTLLRYLDPEKRDPAYREAWERGRMMGKASLRRLQWRHAQQKGSAGVQMTIHLSKHWLGETEKSLMEHTGKDGEPIQLNDVSARETLANTIAGIAARLRAEEGDKQSD